MIAYIVCLGATLVFTNSAEKCLNKKNKMLWIFFSVLAIFVPAFFAGIRAETVGRDISYYVSNIFEYAVKYDYGKYIDICNKTSVEIGYCIFVYVVSIISKDLHFLLFFIQLVPCASVYYFAYKNRENSKMIFVMLIYLLTLYLKSYTIMRQSMALGIIMISIIKFKEGKYISTIIAFFIAIMFHNSAVMALIVYAIIYINNFKRLSSRSKRIIYIMMIGILSLVVLEYKNIIYIFTYNIPVLPSKFYNYLSSNYYSNNLEIVKTDAILKMVCMFFSVFLIFAKAEKKKNDDNIYVFFLIIDIIIFILSFKMTNISRIGYYFFYPSIMYLIPRFLTVFKDDKTNRMGAYLIFISVLLSFWIYTYPIKKDCETYPYKSDIITIFNYL